MHSVIEPRLVVLILCESQENPGNRDGRRCQNNPWYSKQAATDQDPYNHQERMHFQTLAQNARSQEKAFEGLHDNKHANQSNDSPGVGLIDDSNKYGDYSGNKCPDVRDQMAKSR